MFYTGWTKGMKYFGFEKPGARLVSTSIIRSTDITSDEEITHMVMQWGQFLDHDLDHAIPSTTKESWEGLCEKNMYFLIENIVTHGRKPYTSQVWIARKRVPILFPVSQWTYRQMMTV